MQSGNGTQVHEGHDPHGKTADGQRTRNHGMGKTQIDHAKLDDQTGNETEGKAMKETFTIDDIKKIVEKANAKAKFSEDSGDVIANELDKAWNRGVNSMGNNVLILAHEMYWEGIV